MATYSQTRNQGLAAVRAVQSLYRSAKTQGDLLEREILRLRSRKTVISPKSVDKMTQEARDYVDKVAQIAKGVSDLVYILRQIAGSA